MKPTINSLIRVPLDPETVFRHLAEPDLLMSWIKSMRNFQFLGNIENGDLNGAKFTYEAGGQQFAGHVLEYKPTSRYTAFFRSDAYEYTDQFILEYDGTSTILTGGMEIHFKTFLWKLIGRLLSFSIRSDAAKNMEKLKVAVEAYTK